MLIQFVCPHCGGKKLEEIMTDVTVASVIGSIGEAGDLVYGHQTHEDGMVLRYQCMQCGESVKDSNDDDVVTSEHLAEELQILNQKRFEAAQELWTGVPNLPVSAVPEGDDNAVRRWLSVVCPQGDNWPMEGETLAEFLEILAQTDLSVREAIRPQEPQPAKVVVVEFTDGCKLERIYSDNPDVKVVAVDRARDWVSNLPVTPPDAAPDSIREILNG